MWRFQHIDHLYALAVLPLLLGLWLWMRHWRRKRLRQMGQPALLARQMRGQIRGRDALRWLLLGLAVAFIILGWANLQRQQPGQQVARKGVDVVLAVDVSRSMLATDLQPSRLSRARLLIQSLMSRLDGDRVALIVFAGRAYMQVPLTTDYSAMHMALQRLSPDMAPAQGTVISEAIKMASKSFSQKERKYKAMVLISDGEDHDREAADAAREAAEQGVIIHTVGVGSPEGVQLTDPQTQAPRLDADGKPVISRLNEAELKAIAAATQGSYQRLGNANSAAGRLLASLGEMEQKKFSPVLYNSYDSFYQFFLAAALMLLLAEWLLPGARFKQAA